MAWPCSRSACSRLHSSTFAPAFCLELKSMRRSMLARLPAIVISGLLLAQSVMAQRTQENVTTGSEDAFGRSIGNESIGIYNEADVRGFSPIEAGNVRLEGLY